MTSGAEVRSDEFILRRVPPTPHNVKQRPDIGLTATSFAMRPRVGEEGPSWSRASITTPEQLIRIEGEKRGAMVGWHVVALPVARVRELGLDVRFDPTDEDPGHCVIIERTQRFSDKLWSQLAKHTRVLYTHPR